MSASSSGLHEPIPHGRPDDLGIAAAAFLDVLPCPANIVGRDLKMVPDFALCVLQFDQFIRRHVLIHTTTSEMKVLASGSTWALDSDLVGKRTILDCAVVWPSNMAAWLLPRATMAECLWKGFSKVFLFVY